MYRLKIFLLVRVLGLKSGHQFISFHNIALVNVVVQNRLLATLQWGNLYCWETDGNYFTSQVLPLRRRSSTH